VHLAHVAIATRRPVLLQHVLFLFKHHNVRFDAAKAFLQLAHLAEHQHDDAVPTTRDLFPAHADGWDVQRDCPVACASVRFGRVRSFDANDVFRRNVLDGLEDGDNFFDVLDQLVDPHDLPLCYDAITQLLCGVAHQVSVSVTLHDDVDATSGWLARYPRPAAATVRFRFDLAPDARAATYGLLVLPGASSGGGGSYPHQP